VQVLFRSDALPDAAPTPPEHRALERLGGQPPLRWAEWSEPIAAAFASSAAAAAAAAAAHTKPDVGKPDIGRPDIGKADVGKADIGKLDLGSHGPSIHSDIPIEQGLVTRDHTAYASYTRHETPFEGACALGRRRVVAAARGGQGGIGQGWGGQGGGGQDGGTQLEGATHRAKEAKEEEDEDEDEPCVLSVEVGCATALLVLVDGRLVGRAHDRNHDPCTVTLNVTLQLGAIVGGDAAAGGGTAFGGGDSALGGGTIPGGGAVPAGSVGGAGAGAGGGGGGGGGAGGSARLPGTAAAPAARTLHELTIVSEHLGYANYGFREPLLKGIVGAVRLGEREVTKGAWTIRSGLDGERLRLMSRQGERTVTWLERPTDGPGAADRTVRPLTWYRAQFKTPPEVVGIGREKERAELHVNMTGFGRGHVWINGHSLGRYWLLARTTGPEAGVRPTQALYHIPWPWLSQEAGVPNVLTALEGPGGPRIDQASLYLARMAPGPGARFDACTWATTIEDCEM
jgi:hypothetical protein